MGQLITMCHFELVIEKKNNHSYNADSRISLYLFHLLGVIRTQELLDRETTPHYWLTVYAMDRGVVPLSAFVEVFIEVQDVNDNAPQSSEPVYYPSAMENSPKDVSIIKINAVDPDDQASDKLTYRITSGNPQGFFAINTKTGKIGSITGLVVHDTVICWFLPNITQILSSVEMRLRYLSQ